MNVLITAGDPSGDAHAARLMSAIRARVPNVVFEGFGGPAMEMQGLRSIAHLKDLAVSGFWEVAQRIGYFRGLMKDCERIIKERQPKLFIPVDYPGFNIRLASHARAAHIPVAWYIAPQLWAWGKQRAKKLADVVDTLLVVFPFEEEFFSKYGIRTVYVGHPLVEELKKQETPENQKTGNSVDQNSRKRAVVFLPGSRAHELTSHVPLLAGVMKAFTNSEYRFIVPKAKSISDDLLKPLVDSGALIVNDAHDAMQNASAGLIKAGTSTLEATLMNLPFATFYKTSWLSYTLAKNLVNVHSVTMMNLLLKQNVVHEYIQRDATPEKLTKELHQLLEDQSRRHELHQAMNEVHIMLHKSGASGYAADVITDMLGL